MSCWTSNRRGVALVADAIKRHHPGSHVLIGGPHATPLGREMLEHYPAIDTVSLGESEETFMELVARLVQGESPRGIHGTLYRDESGVRAAPGRGSIHDLDALASPHEYFDTHIVMTSRGCPWQCTFCGAETTWGRGFRGQSVPYVLDALANAVSRLSVKMVQIKDDTFTTNKKRVLELCHARRRAERRAVAGNAAGWLSTLEPGCRDRLAQHSGQDQQAHHDPEDRGCRSHGQARRDSGSLLHDAREPR